jgi:hypothetical protein
MAHTADVTTKNVHAALPRLAALEGIQRAPALAAGAAA